MCLYFALLTVENNKNKKSLKLQGDMLNFCGFIQVYVFTTNHHLKIAVSKRINKKFMSLTLTIKGVGYYCVKLSTKNISNFNI